MSSLARMGYALAALALIAPAAAWAGMPQMASDPTGSGIPRLFKHKKSLAHKPERLCAECQRVKLMKEKGVQIPPAPPLPPGRVMTGETCTRCGAAVAVLVTPQPVFGESPLNVADAAPGRAVVGGEPTGYAVFGTEPAPIGVAPSRLASAMPAAPPGGPRDPAVMPTSVARDPIAPPGQNRPHVLSHLFGVSRIGRDRAEVNARKIEEKHASISYGSPTQAVQDVPASVVYGRR
jgi:hypothetical protein